MSTDMLLKSVVDGVATLTLNRPDKRNAMSDDMRSAFIHALEDIAADKSIRARVLTVCPAAMGEGRREGQFVRADRRTRPCRHQVVDQRHVVASGQGVVQCLHCTTDAGLRPVQGARVETDAQRCHGPVRLVGVVAGGAGTQRRSGP